MLAGKTQGSYARLKVTPLATPRLNIGQSESEKTIRDLVDIPQGASSKITDLKKLDAYLQIFSKALKIINGGFGLNRSTIPYYKPQMSKVEVEFYNPTDKTV